MQKAFRGGEEVLTKGQGKDKELGLMCGFFLHLFLFVFVCECVHVCKSKVFILYI